MPQAIAQATLSSAGFVQSIGVCAHLDLTTSSYGNINVVKSQLGYIGVDLVRTLTPPPSLVANYQFLGAAGIKFDFILHTDPGFYMPALDALAPYVQSVEGPNEVNVSPVTYAGLTGPQAAVALQQAIYSAVHNDPLLNGNGRVTPVLDFTLSYGANQSLYGDTSAYADYTNVHAYGGQGSTAMWFTQQTIGQVRISHDLPVIVTETGNYTMPGGGSGVTESVQAKLMTYTLLDDYMDGVVNTYVYQLQDGYADPANTNPEQHYGLYKADGTAKQGALALHNLTTLLGDDGTGTAAASSFTYAVTGLPAGYGNQMALAKSDGTTDIVLWQERNIWDSVNAVEIVNPTAAVTVTLGRVYQTVNLYDVIKGTRAIATFHNVNTVQVALGADAMIVEVVPDAPGQAIDTGVAGGTFASTGADTVTGGQGTAVVDVSSNATVTGGAGAITVNLSGGGASVIGGTGALTVTNTGSNETVTGGAGAFRYGDTGGINTITTGTSASNVVTLGAGTDTVNVTGAASVTTGSGAAVVLLGGAGATVSGGSGSLLVNDAAGGNTVTGGTGAFTFVHAAGDDLVTTGTSASNAVTLGAGSDTVNVRAVATVTGGSGTATVRLTTAGNSVVGGTGLITVIDTSRASTIVGGAGGISYSNAAAGAADAARAMTRVTLGGGTSTATLTAAVSVTGGSGAATVTLNGSAGIVVGAGGALAVVANSGGNTVLGGTGAFTYTSTAGNNVVTTGRGTNQVTLGSGADTIAVVAATALLGGSGRGVVNLASMGSTVTGGAGGLTVVDTTGGNTVDGGSGAFTVTAKVGGDVITTNNTTGTSLVVLGTGSDTVTARGTTSVQGGAASLLVSATGNLTVAGGTGSMTVNGGGSTDFIYTSVNTSNVLNLGSGADTVLGHGADLIRASTVPGAALERIYVGGSATVIGGSAQLSVNGQGYVSVLGATGSVSVTASTSGSYARGGSDGNNLLVAAAGNTTLVGGGARDRLSDTGTLGNNVLQAGPGGATLTAGSGNDTLVGAGGPDIFVLAKAAATHTTVIQGYLKGLDSLSFTGFGSAAPIGSQQMVGANLQLTLADASIVTLLGVSSL